MDSITVLGIIAAMFTTISFLPQAIRVLKTKNTKDLSLLMYCIFTVGVFLWFFYGIIIFNIPIIIANAITFVFATIILLMKIKYK